MKRNCWASLALATSLVWGSGCCCNWFDGCSSSHFGGGGLIGAGSRYAPAPGNPCDCGPTNGHGLGGATIGGGQFIVGEGPNLNAPIISPGQTVYPGNPPRIVPVPPANPTPFTP